MTRSPKLKKYIIKAKELEILLTSSTILNFAWASHRCTYIITLAARR